MWNDLFCGKTDLQAARKKHMFVKVLSHTDENV